MSHALPSLQLGAACLLVAAAHTASADLFAPTPTRLPNGEPERPTRTSQRRRALARLRPERDGRRLRGRAAEHSGRGGVADRHGDRRASASGDRTTTARLPRGREHGHGNGGGDSDVEVAETTPCSSPTSRPRPRRSASRPTAASRSPTATAARRRTRRARERPPVARRAAPRASVPDLPRLRGRLPDHREVDRRRPDLRALRHDHRPVRPRRADLHAAGEDAGVEAGGRRRRHDLRRVHRRRRRPPRRSGRR